MARIYAGILGPLAFLTSLVRGGVHGGTPEAVLWDAWLWLWVFAAGGYLLGWIGQRTMDEAVGHRIRAQWEARRAAAGETPAPPTYR